MNEGEREALKNQVRTYVTATEKKLASIGLPVVIRLYTQDGYPLTEDTLIELAEKK